MIIETKKSFDKSFQKLPKNSQDAVKATLKNFHENPFAPELENHELNGNMKGIRSISVKHDLRIIYREESDHMIVYLIKTGKHTQVYKM